jgi:hypothetical protein
VILWTARAWVGNRRDRYRSRGHPLASDDIDWLTHFHDESFLRDVRLCRTPLHLVGIAGITYGDTILIAPDAPARGLPWRRLLFHELVHVVQYEVLGLEAFLARYLRGWVAAGCRYRGIPLEADAYALEAKFSAEPESRFDVREAVKRRLAMRGER